MVGRSSRIRGWCGSVGLAVIALAAGAHAGPCGNMHVHQPLLALLPTGSETLAAVASGDWTDPATWGGTLPADGDDVLIPAGIDVRFDDPISARIRVLRVDGTLRWATDRDTVLRVDTLFTTPAARLFVGLPSEPIAPGHTAEIIITADAPLDTAWDPEQLSRGVIPHGMTRIAGADKLDFVALEGDARAGDGVIRLALPDGMASPAGWRVGDRIVVTGTSHDPGGRDEDNTRFRDDLLEVTSIDGAEVRFRNVDTGLPVLRFDHVRPDGVLYDPGELRIYAANLTRNVTIRSELDAGSPEPDPIRRRGHVMFMHTPDVVVDNAAFVDLGRSDKNRVMDPASNPRGRYAVHLHRNLPRMMGTGETMPIDTGACVPAYITGSVVSGGPGWGFVHHDSHAVFEDNVSFGVVGSAFVQEAGNEIGRWERNIAIKTTGDSREQMDLEPFPPLGDRRVAAFDFGFNGEGYWIQGASRVAFIDNIAAGAAGGGANVFSQVDGLGEQRDRASIPAGHLPESLRHIVVEADGTIDVSHTPMGTFRGFEVFNSDFGLITWGHMRNQGNWVGFVCPCDGNIHRERSRVEGFRFWNIYGQGIHLQYSSQIDLVDGLIAAPPGQRPAVDLTINGEGRGFGLGMNDPTKRLLVEDVRIEGWAFGLRTPREGSLNAIDGGGSDLGTGESDGLPLRRSTLRGVRLADNTHHLYRRQDGFSDTATFPNFMVLDGGWFEPDAGNAPPVAAFDAAAEGPLGVVVLDASASADPDTPASVANGGNGIAAYRWRFDADGMGGTELWGREVVRRFDPAALGADGVRVELTVYDHMGVPATTTRTIAPRPVRHGERLADPGMDGPAGSPGWDFSTARAGEGWWGRDIAISGGEAVLRGQQWGITGLGQIVWDDRRTRGPMRVEVELFHREAGSANDLMLRVWGVNGEFIGSNEEGEPVAAGAVPMVATLLHAERLLDASGPDAVAPGAWGAVSRTFDAGGAGFDYWYVSLRGRGINAAGGDEVRVRRLSVTGAAGPCSSADIDGVDGLGIGDILAFFDGFARSSPGADVTGDGVVNVFDILAYFEAFGSGC